MAWGLGQQVGNVESWPHAVALCRHAGSGGRCLGRCGQGLLILQRGRRLLATLGSLGGSISTSPDGSSSRRASQAPLAAIRCQHGSCGLCRDCALLLHWPMLLPLQHGFDFWSCLLLLLRWPLVGCRLLLLCLSRDGRVLALLGQRLPLLLVRRLRCSRWLRGGSRQLHRRRVRPARLRWISGHVCW